MSNKGFASLSKQRLYGIAKKGGKAAQLKGTAHKWTSEKARTAALKGVAVRRHNLAVKASLRLLKEGFDPTDLNQLKLTDDEYIYYAGRTATDVQRSELKARIVAVRGGLVIQSEE